MKMLIELDEKMMNSYSSESNPCTKFNAISTKLYFYYKGITQHSRKVNYHSDVSYCGSNSNVANSNNSQKPGTVAVIHKDLENFLIFFLLLDSSIVLFDLL